MENRHRIKITLEGIRTWLGAVIIVALVVMESVICAQYWDGAGVVVDQTWMYIMLIAASILLDVSVALKFYVIKPLRIKFAAYGADFFLLLIISVITGNSFLVVLFCLVTTELYISNESFKINLSVFCLSLGGFIISFVCGWVRLNVGANVYTSIVEILGGCMLGLLVMAIHFFFAMLLMRFYRTTQKLSAALKEADERKAALKDAYEKLSQTAVYEERNRIAKDIHDNAGHSITSVIMQTEAAKLLVDTDPEEAKNKIIAANIQAKNALDQMRTSVHLLAGRQNTVSLKDEIEEIVAQTIDATELKIRCDTEDITLDGELSRFLCNSVKECITNGIRHGGATAFYIEIKKHKDEITFLVSDNGRGLDKDFKEGFGLKGMREKAEHFGGKLIISGEPDEGCEVQIFLPTR